MKKHLIFVVLIFVITNMSFAQKTRFGFRAGPNVTFAKYRFPENDTIYYQSAWPSGKILNREVRQGYSFGVGLVFDLEMPKNTFLTSGITFKGAQHSFTTSTNDFGSSVQNHYNQNFRVFALQVPVFFNYKVNKISAGAGVYGDWQFAGYKRFKNLNVRSLNSRKERLTFGNDEKAMNNFLPFTAGLRGEIGYIKERYRFTAHIDVGLTNVLPSFYREFNSPLSQKSSSSMQYRTFGLSFIYMHWPH